MWIVPTVIEREGAHERVYDLYSCLLKERIVLLSGEIDDQLSSSICAQLLYLSGLSSEAIIFYINSAGGSVSAGLAIYDIMQYIPNEIITIDMGMCASMAAVLLAAGTRGKRFLLPNSEVMIHQPLGQIGGQAKDMEIAAAHIASMKKRLYRILADACNKEVEVIEQDCDRDHYMDAKTAVSYGIADRIITSMQEQ